MNPKHKKHEGTITRHVKIKLLKSSGNYKKLKSNQRKKIYYVQRNKDTDQSRFLVRNNTNKKMVDQYLQSTGSKNKQKNSLIS